MDDSERLANLREAEALLLKAADLIESSVRMSGLEKRYGDLPNSIRSLAASGSGDSVDNLIRDISYGKEEQPIWTRPLVSVKNTDRKDI